MGWGRYARSSNSAPAPVSYEKQVLALARSCSEFGLTSEEVQAISPARYNCCHGNSYPVWNKAQLEAARSDKQRRVQAELAEKEAREKRALEDKYGGAEGLAAHLEDEAKKEKKREKKARAEFLRTRIANLQPGCLAPEALPLIVTSLVMAKKVFFLTDKDLKSLTDPKDSSRLLKAAEKKHGIKGFLAKRQAAADDLAADRRYLLEDELEAIEAKYPSLKVSKATLAARAATQKEHEAQIAEKVAADAADKARAIRAAAVTARDKATQLANAEQASSSKASQSSAKEPTVSKRTTPVSEAAVGAKRKAPDSVVDLSAEGSSSVQKLAPMPILAPIFKQM
eukprot:scaffold23495_cov112-Isochrysis_galbana.AAC.8